jgi:hypothetical protein
LRAKQAASLFPGIAALLLTASSALASANIDCSIDDAHLKFEMEAIASRSGPIQQIHVGSIAIKPAALKLAAPTMTFDRTNLLQQWIQDGDLRLHIEVSDDTAQQNVYLVILARLDSKTEKFFGRYVLRVSRDGKTGELKGRIKECVAG